MLSSEKNVSPNVIVPPRITFLLAEQDTQKFVISNKEDESVLLTFHSTYSKIKVPEHTYKVEARSSSEFECTAEGISSLPFPDRNTTAQIRVYIRRESEPNGVYTTKTMDVAFSGVKKCTVEPINIVCPSTLSLRLTEGHMQSIFIQYKDGEKVFVRFGTTCDKVGVPQGKFELEPKKKYRFDITNQGVTSLPIVDPSDGSLPPRVMIYTRRQSEGEYKKRTVEVQFCPPKKPRRMFVSPMGTISPTDSSSSPSP